LTLQDLTPETIARFEAERKAKQTMNEAEYQEIKQQRLKLQEAAKAKFAAARLNEIHTATKEYICECCGRTIPKGIEYRRQKISVGYGFLEGTHYQTRITHLVCTAEAKQ
jgi:hypothetical protein